MPVIYDDSKKDLPVDQLYHLFFSAGWAGSEITNFLTVFLSI